MTLKRKVVANAYDGVLQCVCVCVCVCKNEIVEETAEDRVSKGFEEQGGQLQFLLSYSCLPSDNSPHFFRNFCLSHSQPTDCQVKLILPMTWAGDEGLNQSFSFLWDHTAQLEPKETMNLAGTFEGTSPFTAGLEQWRLWT